MSVEYKESSHAETEELQTHCIIREKYELRDSCKSIFKMLVSGNVGG